MKEYIIIVFGIFLLASCKTETSNQTNKVTSKEHNSNEYDQIFNKIETVLKANNVPSLSIGIIKNGKQTYRSFGTTNRNNNIKVNRESVYQIASLSKMITGIIANNSILEGKLKLDEPITNYLSHKLNKKAIEKLSEVKVSDLLYHTSGLPRDPKIRESRENGKVEFDAVNGINYLSESDLIKELNQIQLKNPAGTTFEYSNLGYTVLGYILELVNEKTYEDLVNETLVKKYNLKNTFVDSRKFKNRIVTSYIDSGDRTTEQQEFKFGKQIPASGVYSTTEDLLELMCLQIKSFRSQSKNDLVPPNFSSKAYTRRQEKDIAYGFGLFEFSQNKDWKYYEHDGDADGFSSDYYFSPEKNLGLIFLSSSGGNWFGQLANETFFELIENIK